MDKNDGRPSDDKPEVDETEQRIKKLEDEIIILKRLVMALYKKVDRNRKLGRQ